MTWFEIADVNECCWIVSIPTRPPNFSLNFGACSEPQWMTAFAQRSFKILIDFYMCIAAKFLIIIGFIECSARKLAHWMSPLTSELALNCGVDNTCAKTAQDVNGFPHASWCETLGLHLFLLNVGMEFRPPNFTLDLRACSGIRCWHNSHQQDSGPHPA